MPVAMPHGEPERDSEKKTKLLAARRRGGLSREQKCSLPVWPQDTEETTAFDSKNANPRVMANLRKFKLCSWLADAPPRLPENPPRVLPELRQGHAHVALRLHPGHGSQSVVHVPRESFEQNARPLVQGDDEFCLRDQLRPRLGLGF